MRLTMLIPLLILQTGCMHDFSDREPFRSVVGQDVRLVRPVSVNRTTESSGTPIYNLTEVELGARGAPRLGAGTVLHVTCVKAKTFLIIVTLVNGTGVDPLTGEEFNWTYLWGYPWEDNAPPWMERPGKTN